MIPEYVDAGPKGSRAWLFLHGLGGDASNWEPQLEALGAEGRCLAWTMPGFGDSPAGDWTWPAMASAAAAVLDDAGVDSATVVGLSLGGYVAQQMALDHRGRVERLVLAATTARFGAAGSPARRREFIERFLSARLAPLDRGLVPADFAADVVAGLMSAEADGALVAAAIASMSRISAEAYRSALELLVSFDIEDRLEEIVVPVLCIAGSADRTASPTAMGHLADRLIDGELVVVDGANHLVNLDRPAAFNKVLMGHK